MKSVLRALGACLLLLTAGPALAQTEISPPAAYNLVDGNGVNLQTGRLTANTTTIAVGPASGGLSYSRSYDGTDKWRDSVYGGIHKTPANPIGPVLPWFTVTVMGKSSVFSQYTTDFTLVEGDYGSLTLSGGVYTYTAADGSVATFLKSKASYTPYLANEGLITSLTRPNGEVLTFTYASIDRGPGQLGYRLQSVTNNRGYQLKFQYAFDGSWTSDWYRLVKATALNNAVEACDPAAPFCTFSQAWPELNFSVDGTSQVITDTLGRTTRYFNSGGLFSGIRKATSSSGQDVTATWTFAFGAWKVTTITTAGGAWTYAYETPTTAPATHTLWTDRTDPLGHKTRIINTSFEADSDMASRRVVRPTKVIDAVFNETAYDYGHVYWLTKITRPELDQDVYDLDGRGNVTKFTKLSKSGLSSIASSASYPVLCSANPRTCNRPASVTDARGATTSLTYDGVHGGLLTVTAPAPTAGAVQPQTRTSYTALSARYKDAAGTLVDGPAITLPTQTSACVTTASCAGGADETRTTITYQAGGVSLASNLLPVITSSGSGDGLLTATTTMTYLPTGDVKTVDGPLPGVADTTRSYYDVMRQTTGVVGPDPDGAGALLYRASRTTYNAAGQVTLAETGTATSQADNAMGSFAPLLKTANAYDSLGRKIQDRQLSAADAIQTQTQYAYDGANRLTCQTVRMNPATFSAAPGACVLGTGGPDGPDRITYTDYDDVDRPTQVTSGYGTSGAYGPRVEKKIVYSHNSKEQIVTDGEGNFTIYEYDGFDRLAKVRYPTAVCCTNTGTDYDLYSYDAADNRVGWRKRSGEIITTTFDALNRVTYHDGVPTWVYYNNLGQPTYTYAGASAEKVIAHYYDGLGRPSYTYDYRDGAWYPTYTGYDLAGRRTLLQWTDGNFVNYDYDVTGAMVGVRENNTTYLATFGYDDLGRRTFQWRGDNTISYYNYYPNSDLYAITHDLAGTAQDQAWTFTYNAAGQVKTRTSNNPAYDWTPGPAVDRGYTINGLNQITSVGPAGTSGTPITYDGRGNLNSDGATSFIYDIDNHLISASGASSTTLSYDPLGRLGQTAATTATTRFVYSGSDLIAELNTSNAIVRRYVPGPGTDEPLVWYEGSGVGDRRWLLPDAQGSIVAVTGASGPATINTYDEYGVPAAGNVGRYQYTGQTWLPEVGLYNYKARVYSPTLGRFLQTDPTGYDDGLNWYAYVGNDPLNWSDPSGLAAKLPDPNVVEEARVCADGSKEIAGVCIWQPKPPISIGHSTVTAGLFQLPERFPVSGPELCRFTLDHLGDTPVQIAADAIFGTVVGKLAGGATGSLLGKGLDSGPVLGSRVGRTAIVGARAGRIGGVIGAVAGAAAGMYFKDEIERVTKGICGAK